MGLRKPKATKEDVSRSWDHGGDRDGRVISEIAEPTSHLVAIAPISSDSTTMWFESNGRPRMPGQSQFVDHGSA